MGTGTSPQEGKWAVGTWRPWSDVDEDQLGVDCGDVAVV
jgi:hypothetical protein